MTERDTRGTKGELSADRTGRDRSEERAVSRRTVLKGGAVGAIAAAVGVRAMPGGDDDDDPDDGLGGSSGGGSGGGNQETDPYEDYEGDEPPEIDGAKPTDPDGDGLYEDLNGDGEASEADADIFADRQDDPVIKSFPEYYDFSGNGKIDAADSVDLYQEVSE